MTNKSKLTNYAPIKHVKVLHIFITYMYTSKHKFKFIYFTWIAKQTIKHLSITLYANDVTTISMFLFSIVEENKVKIKHLCIVSVAITLHLHTPRLLKYQTKVTQVKGQHINSIQLTMHPQKCTYTDSSSLLAS